MSSVIYSAPKLPGDPMPPSSTDQGHEFPLCLFFDGGASIAYADSFDDLVDVLLPGYLTWTVEQQQRARIDYAVSQAIWVQAQVWAENTTVLTPDQEALLGAPRVGDSAPTGIWDASVPLVVVASSYAPYTTIAIPVGQGTTQEGEPSVWVLDPTSEETLLTTLHEVGAVRLMTRSM